MVGLPFTIELCTKKNKLGGFFFFYQLDRRFKTSIFQICSYHTRFTYLQCMPHVHLNDLWTNRRHMCITDSRRGECSQPCATTSVPKCKKDSKMYVERVPDFQVSNTSLNVWIWSFLEMATLCYSFFNFDITTMRLLAPLQRWGW